MLYCMACAVCDIHVNDICRSHGPFFTSNPNLHVSTSCHLAVDWSQTYEGEIVDDYITGVEQVGVDPTAAVETVVPVETQEEVKTNEKVDSETKAYEFEEYDLKEYDNKEFLEKPYDYGNYDDTFGQPDANPTSVTFEEHFGPGSPAETDIRESSVSDTAGRGGRGSASEVIG